MFQICHNQTINLCALWEPGLLPINQSGAANLLLDNGHQNECI